MLSNFAMQLKFRQQMRNPVILLAIEFNRTASVVSVSFERGNELIRRNEKINLIIALNVVRHSSAALLT
jgi:predicted nicotinamide N-methyase